MNSQDFPLLKCIVPIIPKAKDAAALSLQQPVSYYWQGNGHRQEFSQIKKKPDIIMG